jgi:hypothetical protein
MSSKDRPIWLLMIGYIKSVEELECPSPIGMTELMQGCEIEAVGIAEGIGIELDRSLND